jgi:hypothetical protein
MLKVCFQAIFPGLCRGFITLLSQEYIRCYVIRCHAVWYTDINILQPAVSSLGCKSVMKGKIVCDVRKRRPGPYPCMNQS